MKTRLYLVLASSLSFFMVCTDISLASNDIVRTFSSESNKRQAQAEQVECDAKDKEINKEANKKIEQLNNEMHDVIAANGQSVHGSHQSYNPAPLNESIKQDYAAQIDKIKSQAKDHADRIIAAYRAKAKLLEDSQ